MTTRGMNRRRWLGAAAVGGIGGSLGTQATRLESGRVWGGEAVAGVSDGRPGGEDAQIERLAEKIMETPPSEVAAMAADEIRNGLSRNRLFAACFNAGIRFHGHHSGYVAHPVEVVGRQLDGTSSLLPLFYYLSVLRFRSGRSRYKRLSSSGLPDPSKATAQFHAAMEQGEAWDSVKALISLSRAYGPHQAYQNLWFYGAQRNHRSGGHAAVSIANTFRTLQASDWRCAETALQFAVSDVAQRPGGSSLHAENRLRSHRINELPVLWSTSTGESKATSDLLNEFRRGRPAEACQMVFDGLKAGAFRAGAVWDAIFMTTAEMVVRYRWVGQKMLAGHSVTCVNGLHFMFRTLTQQDARLYSLLESVEWTTSFLARERARPALRDLKLTEIEPLDFKSGDDSLSEIFSKLPPRRFASMNRVGFEDVDRAMGLTLRWAQRNPDALAFQSHAIDWMCRKSTPEVHDFKFPMALLENMRYANVPWRPFLLAASVHVLQGPQMEDAPIVAEGRELLGA